MGAQSLMLEMVMALGEGSVKDRGNVDWQGRRAAGATGCDFFFLSFHVFKI